MVQLTPDQLSEICRVVHTACGISLTSAKRHMIQARLGRVLRALGTPSPEEYLRLLRTDSTGWALAVLLDAISTNHSTFFRDADHFDLLRHEILPGLARRRTVIKIWSAASAAGQEAYSIAIECLELAAQLPAFPKVDILGTDISGRALGIAGQGIYPIENVAHVPRERLHRWFRRGVGERAGYVRVKEEVRAAARFERANLVADRLSDQLWDVIFLCNVMIYFDRRIQQVVLSRMEERLQPGGWLFIGSSETLTGLRHMLVPHSRTVLRKRME